MNGKIGMIMRTDMFICGLCNLETENYPYKKQKETSSQRKVRIIFLYYYY